MDWRKPSLLILLMLLSGIAAASVQYNINADENQALINTTVQLECEGANCPVASWSLTLDKPAGANVTDVEAARGEISNYQVHGDKILVQTRSDQPTETEFIEISYRVDEDAEELRDGLYTRKISLPGFSGESNSGTIKTMNLITASGSHGFETQVTNDTFKFQGEGPARAKLSFGEGHETEYFEFFGSRPDETSLAYEVAVGTLGFAHRSDKLPAAVLPNYEYNQTVNRWSSGRYIDGNIILREDLGSKFLSVLAHETAHALNDQHLKWDRTSSAWFDEGTSKYLEFLVEKSVDGQDRTRELFGDEVAYVARENGDRYKYTLPPKGSKEKLWQYYQNNMSFMKAWNSDSRERNFGYAYSELIIRNHISKNNSLSELYTRLDREQAIEDNDEKWIYYSQYIDLRPCDHDSREKFESCLERINNHDYPVYTAEPSDDTQELQIEELEAPNKSEPNTAWIGSGTQREVNVRSVLAAAFRDLNDLIQNLANSL